MEYTLSMTFLTDLGVKSTLSVSGVKTTITEAQANALMDTIIAKNIFLTTTGALAKKESSQLTEKNYFVITLLAPNSHRRNGIPRRLFHGCQPSQGRSHDAFRPYLHLLSPPPTCRIRKNSSGLCGDVSRIPTKPY